MTRQKKFIPQWNIKTTEVLKKKATKLADAKKMDVSEYVRWLINEEYKFHFERTDETT